MRASCCWVRSFNTGMARFASFHKCPCLLRALDPTLAAPAPAPTPTDERSVGSERLAASCSALLHGRWSRTNARPREPSHSPMSCSMRFSTTVMISDFLSGKLSIMLDTPSPLRPYSAWLEDAPMHPHAQVRRPNLMCSQQ